MLGEIWAVVTLIMQFRNGQLVGAATGFFYLKDDVVYLSTNRHVVLEEAKGIKPEVLRLRLHLDPNDITKNADFDVPLYSKGIAKWHVHPEYPVKKIDVAVVEVDQKLLNGMSGSPVLTKPKNIWQDNKGNTDILTGSPIYFLGVHSATLSVMLSSGQEPLGLGSVWYGRVIEEIIPGIKARWKSEVRCT